MLTLCSVVEAQHLAAASKEGTSDPYTTIKSSFNKQNFKSKVVKKTVHPKWDEEFRL